MRRTCTSLSRKMWGSKLLTSKLLTSLFTEESSFTFLGSVVRVTRLFNIITCHQPLDGNHPSAEGLHAQICGPLHQGTGKGDHQIHHLLE